MYPYGFPGVPLVQPGQGTNVPLELPKEVLRVGEQSIWSTTRIGAGAVASQAFRFFSTPLGQQGQGFGAGLSISETNLKEGGRIPSGLAFDALGIACIPQGADTAGNHVPDVAQDVQTFLRHGVLSWDFLQTVIDVAPISLIGAGGGANVMRLGANQGAAAAADTVSAVNGFGGLWVYRKFPVALPANSTFNILMRMGTNAPATTVAYDIKVALIGAFKTAIEIG
jgi:hypothetical protein